jgi:DNA-binding NarL/FixJ family response regulator
MKKTILVADKDESLQHAFMTVFSRDHFEIIYASNGKEIEKIADRIRPDVYIVNVDLPKTSGIEVYKNLQKKRVLDSASFFFLKDESDTTELLGYQADGILEKPLNFFKVYETVTKEEEIIELTDLIEEETESATAPPSPDPQEVQEPETAQEPEAEKWEFFNEPLENIGTVEVEPEIPTEPEVHTPPTEETPVTTQIEPTAMASLESRLKDAMDGIITGNAIEKTENHALEEEPKADHQQLEEQLKVVLNQALGEAALKLSARLAPVLTHYVEDYVNKMLLEIAEKVIKEEIDKLLKESAG